LPRLTYLQKFSKLSENKKLLDLDVMVLQIGTVFVNQSDDKRKNSSQ